MSKRFLNFKGLFLASSLLFVVGTLSWASSGRASDNEKLKVMIGELNHKPSCINQKNNTDITKLCEKTENLTLTNSNTDCSRRSPITLTVRNIYKDEKEEDCRDISFFPTDDYFNQPKGNFTSLKSSTKRSNNNDLSGSIPKVIVPIGNLRDQKNYEPTVSNSVESSSSQSLSLHDDEEKQEVVDRNNSAKKERRESKQEINVFEGLDFSKRPSFVFYSNSKNLP